MKLMRLKFLSICFVGVCWAADSASADSCDAKFQDVKGKSSLGSAGTWANLRGSEGSLKAETQKLLTEGEKTLSGVPAPANFCGEGCELAKQPILVFRSTPNKFLDDYGDAEDCKQRFAKTKQDPIRYNSQHFSSLEDLNSWFSDFSQGKGKEGGDLYQRCPGDCSPQYTNLITRDGAKYVLSSEVVCGPARDKSDNQYQLTSSYRWRCEKKG